MGAMRSGTRKAGIFMDPEKPKVMVEGLAKTWPDMEVDPSMPVGMVEFRHGNQVVGKIVNLSATPAYYEFTLYGITKSKKNTYTPKRTGGMYKNTELQAELDNLEAQVPGDVRDLRLEHPDVLVEFSSRSKRRDRDGLLTTVLDVLVKCGVFQNDDIAHFNGTVTLLPAKVGQEDAVHLLIFPKQE
jgi:Holliday junction resolvase RusA-like endonuclease